MRDIVIVPTYDRPEYLSLCLEALLEASKSKEIWVCEDDHVSVVRDQQTIDDTGFVIHAWKSMSGADIRHIQRRPHNSYGNSYNVLESFREAYATDARYVYLVEDDVMVQPDFFQWHEAVQEMWSPFVSCAGRINRSLNFEMNGREAIDESCKDPLACVLSRQAYGSWAACFKTQTLSFAATGRDNSVFKPGLEQDIMIQQILRGFSSFSIWPYVPRAYHMGWYSYHRTAGLRFNGSLGEKVAALRNAMSDPQKIREMACLQEIDPFPTEPVPAWSGPLYLKSDYRR